MLPPDRPQLSRASSQPAPHTPQDDVVIDMSLPSGVSPNEVKKGGSVKERGEHVRERRRQREYHARSHAPTTAALVMQHRRMLVEVPPRAELLRLSALKKDEKSGDIDLDVRNSAELQQMLAMDLKDEEATIALVLVRMSSVEEAVEVIFANADRVFHRFVPRRDDKQACRRCEHEREAHLLDMTGERIGITRGLPAHVLVEESEELARLIAEEEYAENQSAVRPQEDPEDNAPLRTLFPARSERPVIRINADLQRRLREEAEEEARKKMEAEARGEVLHECQICFDSKPADAFFQGECGHGYCHECMCLHYRARVEEGDVLRVQCVDPDCEREVSDEEFGNFVEAVKDAELTAKYERYKRNKLVALNKNARWCPKPGCDGFVIGSSRLRRLRCAECDTAICFGCGQEWHGYLKRCRNSDRGVATFLALRNAQRCPRCRHAIVKNGGCNHMTCGACGYEFCWLCRRHYTYDHFEVTCKNLIYGCPGGQSMPCVPPSCCPGPLRSCYFFFWLLVIFFVGGPLLLAFGAAGLALYLVGILLYGIFCCCGSGKKLLKWFDERFRCVCCDDDWCSNTFDLAYV